MKLSEAIVLGSVLVEMKPGCWSTCALGGAARAVGIPPTPESVLDQWPWLEPYAEAALTQIVTWFDDWVCEGEMTLDELADIVRRMEPSCGQCNVHDCPCETLHMPRQVAQRGVERADAAVRVICRENFDPAVLHEA